jgi:hypothetical protein
MPLNSLINMDKNRGRYLFTFPPLGAMRGSVLPRLTPCNLGNYNMQTSKFFFWVFLTMNFFTSKFMINKWFFFFFGSFAPHFEIKLSIHGSNLNSMFVIMCELNFFLLTGVLTQNFNTMDLIKFLGKNQKVQIEIILVTLKVTSCKTMSKKKK